MGLFLNICPNAIFFFIDLPYEAVIPIEDNALNDVSVTSVRGATSIRHILNIDDPESGLVLVTLFPSENVTLTAYLSFDEIATQEDYFINLTVSPLKIKILFTLPCSLL